MKNPNNVHRLIAEKELKYYFSFGLNPIRWNGFTTLVVISLKCECSLFNHLR